MATRWQSFSPVWNQLQQLNNGPLWNQLQSLHHEMNRLFDRWTQEGLPGYARAGEYPAVNVFEDADSLYIEAELPGVSQDKLEVYVTGGVHLTLKGKQGNPLPEKGIWHRQERGSGAFSRTLTLPCQVDRDKVEARLENGVLSVKLAKQESSKPRKIVVKSE
jgi:HSP20 family protein